VPTPLCNAGMREAALRWNTSQAPSCGAGGLEDVKRWSAWGLASAAAHGHPAYEDGDLNTADGVYAKDAALCSIFGLVDPPHRSALMVNATALREMAEQRCASGPVQEAMRTTTDAEVAALDQALHEAYLVELHKPVALRVSPMTHEAMLKYSALNCRMGTLSCAFAFCLESFCRLPGGGVGMGCQCGVSSLLGPGDTVVGASPPAPYLSAWKACKDWLMAAWRWVVSKVPRAR